MQISQSMPLGASSQDQRAGAAAVSAPHKAPVRTVRFAPVDAAGSQDSYVSSLALRHKNKLRRYGQNAKGFVALGLTCCMMPCMGRRPGL